MEEEKQEIITLVDEEGEKFDFLILDHFKLDELEYAILLPVQEEEGEEGEGSSYSPVTGEEGEEEAVIFRIEAGDEGETNLHVIEDEDEWQKVAEVAYERLMNEDLDKGEEE